MLFHSKFLLFRGFPGLLYASNITDLLTKADSALSQLQYSTALIHLKNATQEELRSLEIRFQLAKIYLLTGQGLQAIKTLASVYLKRQQGSLALTLLESYKNLKDAYVMSLRSIASGRVGNKERKDFYMDRTLNLATDDLAMKRQFQLSRLEEGESLDITFTDTEYEDPLFGGHIPILNLFRQKKYDEALVIIHGYLNKTPENGLLYFLEGSVYSEMKGLPKANRSFEFSIEKIPSLLDSHISLARIYQSQSDDEKVEDIFRDVLRLNKNNDSVLVALAGIYHRKGDDAEMVKVFQAV